MSEYALKYTGNEVDALLALVNNNKDVISTAGDSIEKLNNAVESLGGKIDEEGSVPLMNTLWSNINGDWSGSAMTVDTLGDYSIVAIVFDNSFCAICYKYNGSLNGGATWISDNGAICSSHVSFTVAGDIITRNEDSIKHVVLYGDNVSNEPIVTRIIGVC